MHRCVERVLISLGGWRNVWCRVSEDTPALADQPGLDIRIPTHMARDLRLHVQSMVGGLSPLFGKGKDNDDPHTNPEHRRNDTLPATSNGSWPATGASNLAADSAPEALPSPPRGHRRTWMQFGNRVNKRQDPHALLEYRRVGNNTTQENLREAAAFKQGAITMSPLHPKDCEMRAAMQFNDTIVIQEKLDDPGCVGLGLRLYMEAIQISVDKCRLTRAFADFACTVARTSLAKPYLPERRRLKSKSPSVGAHRGNWPGRREEELGSLYDPLLHPTRTPSEPTTNTELAISSSARDARTASVPYLCMD